MAMPKRINQNWIRQQETKLGCSAKKLPGGEPSPAYETLAAEIAEAKAEAGRRDVFEAWVKKELGAVLNQYPARSGGATYEPGKAFVRKDKTTGVMTVWPVEQAWVKYEAAIEVPPS